MNNFNINLLGGNKMLLNKQCFDYYSQAPLLVKKCMNVCFFNSFIGEPRRATDHTKTLKDRSGII